MRMVMLLAVLLLPISISSADEGGALAGILSGIPGFGGGQSPPPPVGHRKVLSEAEAARFLQQATFGPTPESIARLQKMGYRKWLRWQKSLPPTTTRERVEALAAQQDEESGSQEPRLQAWWKAVLYGPDQLRQRMAFALSEIFVVSDRSSALEGNPVGMAAYYDLLVEHALGNYRDLLEAVSTSPMMGLYLSHLQNQRAWPEEHIRPDENYAREVLQLFSIGLWQLNPDGSRRLDAEGRPIPTYDQDVVEHFARVFTGWNYAEATEWDYYPEDPYFWRPMKPYRHVKEWERPGGYHDRQAKRLLAYPEAGVPPDQWVRAVLPALKAGEDARTDLERALDNIFYHPNVGPFIARRLIQRLVTSNPSPDYIRRVAEAFDDNGQGVRGDLFAVARAILLDPEARQDPAQAGPTFGKLREPLLRQTHLWRALQGEPVEGGEVQDTYPEYEHGQAPLRAPSVFNFFRPDDAPPGEIAEAGLVAPEFQLVNETYVSRDANAVLYRLLAGYPGSPWKWEGALELERLPELARLARRPARLVDWLDRVFMARQMPDDMRSLLIDTLKAVPLRDDLEGSRQKGMLRAITGVYLVLTSPDYMVQK